MMPIRPENRARYPKDWRNISLRIRFDRAEGRCECDGRCGHEHEGGRCAALHGKLHPVTGSRVALTVMHLDHVPEHCADENLLAGCQRCHLAYDAEHHAANRRDRLERERRAMLDKAGQLAFSIECETGGRVAR